MYGMILARQAKYPEFKLKGIEKEPKNNMRFNRNHYDPFKSQSKFWNTILTERF